MKLSDSVTVDDDCNLLVVFGQKMTAEFLKAFCEPTPEDMWFRVERRADGALTISQTVIERPRTRASAH